MLLFTSWIVLQSQLSSSTDYVVLSLSCIPLGCRHMFFYIALCSYNFCNRPFCLGNYAVWSSLVLHIFRTGFKYTLPSVISVVFYFYHKMDFPDHFRFCRFSWTCFMFPRCSKYSICSDHSTCIRDKRCILFKRYFL